MPPTLFFVMYAEGRFYNAWPVEGQRPPNEAIFCLYSRAKMWRNGDRRGSPAGALLLVPMAAHARKNRVFKKIEKDIKEKNKRSVISQFHVPVIMN